MPSQPNRPANPSATRPNVPDRPVAGNRPDQGPQTKPGNVNYPNAGPPVVGNRPGNNQANRPLPDRRPVVTRPGQNTRPVKRPNVDHQVGTRPGQKPSNWWDAGRPNNRPVNRPSINNIHGNNNVHINNNFCNNVNWSTHRKHWGYNPWWNRPATRPWYGGSWNCGWNSSYYRRNYDHHHYYGGYRPFPGYAYYDDGLYVSHAIGWGLVGWSLGRLVYDCGYQTYTNPYPAQPLYSSVGAPITYTQPMSVVAAETAPSDEEAGKVTEASESSIIASQEAFKQKDYLTALDGANKAIGEAPGDGALHEYRALVLFALGKFSEAAGVLNPVLAGGPGWDWATMISLYGSQETYMSQLAALENYAKSKADAADARFLLGYHYMVCGHLQQANAEFSAAARLQPADSVAAQLRDLTGASSNHGKDDAPVESAAAEEDAPPPSAPIPLEKLIGTWLSDKGAGGTVALVFKDDGKFVWTFKKDDKSNEFGGDFSMNDNGLLVLDAEESQMVAEVALPQDNELKFVLSGGPPGDPGLVFVRK